MSNTIAQNPTAQTYSGATSVQATYGSACTNGSLLIAGMTAEGNVTLGVSDPTNGAFTSAVSAVGSANSKGEIFYFNNQAGTTALTVTGTAGSASYGALKILEVTGQAAASVLGQTGAFNTAAVPTITLTGVADNSTIVAVQAGYPPPDSTPVNDSGYTLGGGPTAGNASYHLSEFIGDAGATGNKTLNWNGSTASLNYGAFVAAEFKTSAGGGGGAIDTGKIFKRTFRPRPFAPGNAR